MVSFGCGYAALGLMETERSTVGMGLGSSSSGGRLVFHGGHFVILFLLGFLRLVHEILELFLFQLFQDLFFFRQGNQFLPFFIDLLKSPSLPFFFG